MTDHDSGDHQNRDEELRRGKEFGGDPWKLRIEETSKDAKPWSDEAVQSLGELCDQYHDYFSKELREGIDNVPWPWNREENGEKTPDEWSWRSWYETLASLSDESLLEQEVEQYVNFVSSARVKSNQLAALDALQSLYSLHDDWAARQGALFFITNSYLSSVFQLLILLLCSSPFMQFFWSMGSVR